MAEVSRRTVMAFGVGAVGAATFATVMAPPALGAPRAATAAFVPAPPAGPSVRSHFAPHLGETFLADSGAGSIALTLSAIADLPHAPAADENRFSLIFTAPAGVALQASIYTLTHPVAPETMLFLGPVGDPSEHSAQALVNRAP